MRLYDIATQPDEDFEEQLIKESKEINDEPRVSLDEWIKNLPLLENEEEVKEIHDLINEIFGDEISL